MIGGACRRRARHFTASGKYEQALETLQRSDTAVEEETPPSLNYFLYPTGSDSLPSNDLMDPDPGNNANTSDNGYTIGSPNFMTEVGAFENSDSPYGTFDQGGNVMEWTETAKGLDGFLYRDTRGGDWDTNPDWTAATHHFEARPTTERRDFGFRVASVPEPGSLTLVLCGALAGLLWWRRWR